MDREERDARIGVEHLLSPVAMMDVKVHDQDPVEPPALAASAAATATLL